MSRALCPRCERPLTVCLCDGLETQTAPIDLLLLQTRQEQKHPLNSGRILRLGINNCQVLVGEDFSESEQLNALLKQYAGRVWLLYPGEQSLPPAELLSTGSMPQQEGRPLLIVLDATWRKSRLMLHLCPVLADLPRVSLPEAHVSQYKIRKVPGDGYLSTVEAVTTVLDEVKHPASHCQQLLAVFEQMINRQIQAMGEETFRKNYSKQPAG